VRAHDIEKLVSVGRPTISRDGSFAVFATSRPSIEANRDIGRLFRTDLETGAVRPLTRGVADSSPRLSPDDTRIGFVRGDAKDKPQLWVVEAAGGEPVQVTDAPLGIRSFDWSPDGTRLAFTAPVPERGRYGTVEGLDASAEAPRHITGVRWHSNGAGYIGDRPTHVFVVAAPDLSAEPAVKPAAAVRPEGQPAPEKAVVPAEATQLTEGADAHAGAVFTADGSEVLTVVDSIEQSGRDLRTPLVAVRVDGSGEREVLPADAGLSISDVAVAPDGTIALLASDTGESHVDFVAASAALWIVDGGAPRRLTDPETSDLGEVGSHITPLGDGFLVQNRTRGRVELQGVSRAGDV
jgi:dipeptidyl aminopeptidase/acylaminoacyl peptidase